MTKTKLITLKGQKHFTDTLRSSKRFSAADCAVNVRFRRVQKRISAREEQTGEFSKPEKAIDSEPCIEFAVVARKKIVKSAVARNRVRRLVRVALRQALEETVCTASAQLLCPIEALIVFWNKPVEHPKLLRLAPIRETLKSLIVQAIAYNAKRTA